MIQKLAKFEEAMLDRLKSPASTTATAKRILKRTLCQFVIDYGFFYTPGPLPKKVKLGKLNECYKNALELVLHNPSMIYVEGYAAGEGGLPIRHAWVTDGKGRAIDNTCGELNVVYAGVPFRTRFISAIALKQNAHGSVIDDWENNWPLLNELGDQPEKWLELRGKSFKKLN